MVDAVTERHGGESPSLGVGDGRDVIVTEYKAPHRSRVCVVVDGNGLCSCVVCFWDGNKERHLNVGERMHCTHHGPSERTCTHGGRCTCYNNNAAVFTVSELLPYLALGPMEEEEAHIQRAEVSPSMYCTCQYDAKIPYRPPHAPLCISFLPFLYLRWFMALDTAERRSSFDSSGGLGIGLVGKASLMSVTDGG